MSGSNPRKRQAPGASPAVPLPQMPGQMPGPLAPNDQIVVPWSGQAVDSNNTFAAADGAMRAQQQYPRVMGDGSINSSSNSSPAMNSDNTVARRPAASSRALVPTAQRSSFGPGANTWPGYAADDDALALHASLDTEASEHNNIEKMEEAALKVKMEAKAKRKQIPPFVQKLSSFLEERKNEDLIRWSENGDSFVVLDEDEFAKTLIPDMFKHNNYASFVRQLNMYGFHKRVGLSDNSMRASERKNKSPSEYANPFFRRGHPNLLWLINKPKNGGGGGRAKRGGPKGVSAGGDGEVDSDDDGGGDDASGQGSGGGPANALLGRSQHGGGDYPASLKKELSSIHEEVARLQDQNHMVLSHLNRLQNNNKEMYRRVSELHAVNDRHQTSINAMLSFLSNVFRKAVPDPSVAQTINDAIMNFHQGSPVAANTMPHGSIVDLGDVVQAATTQPANPGMVGMAMAPHRRARQQLLLQAAPGHNAVSLNDAQQGVGPRLGDYGVGTVTELFDPLPDATTTAAAAAAPHGNPNIASSSSSASNANNNNNSHFLATDLEDNPQEKMMQIIHETNATLPGAAARQLIPPQHHHQYQQQQQQQQQQQVHPSAGYYATSRHPAPSGYPTASVANLQNAPYQSTATPLSTTFTPATLPHAHAAIPATAPAPTNLPQPTPAASGPTASATALSTPRPAPSPTPAPAPYAGAAVAAAAPASTPSPAPVSTLANVPITAPPLPPTHTPSLTPLIPAIEYDQSDEIANLRRISEDSTAKLNEISARLGGLSPNLDGLTDYFALGDPSFDHPADLPFDTTSFINPDAEFGDFSYDGADLAEFGGLDLATHTAGATAAPSPSGASAGDEVGQEVEDPAGAERAAKRRRGD